MKVHRILRLTHQTSLILSLLIKFMKINKLLLSQGLGSLLFPTQLNNTAAQTIIFYQVAHAAYIKLQNTWPSVSPIMYMMPEYLTETQHSG